MKKKFLLTVLFASILIGQAWAQKHYDFSAKCSSGQILYFIITSDTSVCVTYPCTYNEDKPGNNKYAYYGYTKPTGDLIIPETVNYNSVEYSVTSIDKLAFYGCSLTSISIPNSITIIGERAFHGCNLSYNEYDNAYYLGNNSNPFLVLVRETSSDITSCEINGNCRVIYSYAFNRCNNLKSINIPNSVTNIGANTFSYCFGLTSVTISNSITKIDEFAFSDCNNLDFNIYDNGYYLGNTENPFVVLFEAKTKNITSCEINERCRIIYGAFNQCQKLTNISIPNSVVSIGYHAFSNCSSLTSIVIPNSVRSIGIEAFSGCCIPIIIPNSVTEIGNTAFQSCKMDTIVIPDAVVNIGYNAFEWCGASSIKLGHSVKFIGDGAFSNCGIETITIPNSVISIGDGVFNGCWKLKSVIIGNSVDGIGQNAFGECRMIVCLNTNPATLDSDPFITDTIFVPNQAISSYKTAPIWKRKEILPFYNVKARSADESLGTVIGDSLQPYNKSTSIFATPKLGYHFTHWSDGNTDNPRVYSTMKDTSFTAIFEAHTAVTDESVSATCTATGLTEGSHCSVCNSVLVAQTEIPMAEHSAVEDIAIAATCTEPGLSEGKHCSICNATIVAQTKIPALGHEFKNYIYNNDATAEADGTETAVCERGCGATDTRVKEGTKLATTAISESASNTINIYAIDNSIVIENTTEEIRVYNAMGALVGRDAARHVSTITVNGTGVYIVKTGGVVKRVMVN